MTTIDRMAQLLSTLRQELTDQVQTRRVSTRGVEASEESGQHAAPLNVQGLKSRIGRELKRYDLKSAAGKKQARHVFIESVLAWDMGEDISRDPRFGFIVRDIEESMNSDQAVTIELDKLLLNLQEH